MVDSKKPYMQKGNLKSQDTMTMHLIKKKSQKHRIMKF